MAKSKKIERKADQIQEIKKCGIDPAYFINKYIKISHPTRGPIPFQLYPYQLDCLGHFQKHRMLICNKSRQLGLSTVSAAYSLWLALFRRNKNIIILATRLETAKLFLEKIKTMFDSLPEWLVMPTLNTVSVREMKFSNKSIIKALPCTENAARGEAASLLVVDEAAHIENFDEIWTGLQPIFNTGGNVILISSPKGVGNQFYNIWQGASDNGIGSVGTNGFLSLFLPWTVHPEHDEAWFQQQCAALLGNPRAIAQELLGSFETSGFSFLDTESMKWLASKIETPITRYGQNLDMLVWKYPEFSHKYIISADVARGDADDFSAMHVIDATEQEIVAEFKGRMQPDKFGEFLVDIAQKYNNGFIAHEMNSAGIVTSYKLKELKYGNVYYEKLFNGNVNPQYRVDETEDLIPGFTTSVKTRPDILAKLETILRNRHLKCRSERLVNEFKTFHVENGKPKAQKNCHDDLVMALAIGVNFMEFARSNQATSDEYAMAMISAMSRESRTMPKWGHAGTDLATRSGWGHRTPVTPQENVDYYKSFDWLLK